MSLLPEIRGKITLPAVCAPMFLVSSVDLVVAAAKAGIVAGVPRGNFRSFEDFKTSLTRIRVALDAYREVNPAAPVGPIAVNLSTAMDRDEARRHIEICEANGVRLFITATGNPTEMIRHVHEFGGKVICDAVSMRFAEKAIAAGADGVTAICAGGGGHSGTLNPFAFVPRIREMFDGTIILGGAISSGEAIRAAQVLGADLAYLGTRFIATQEANAPDAHKRMLVSQAAKNLTYTPAVTGVPANWLDASLREAGLDPDNLPEPVGRMRYDHLPDDVRPWRDIWSAGQGIETIHDIPTVAELVRRLRDEYASAFATPI